MSSILPQAAEFKLQISLKVLIQMKQNEANENQTEPNEANGV